jgi:hypothetical protein
MVKCNHLFLSDRCDRSPAKKGLRGRHRIWMHQTNELQDPGTPGLTTCSRERKTSMSLSKGRRWSAFWPRSQRGWKDNPSRLKITPVLTMQDQARRKTAV